MSENKDFSGKAAALQSVGRPGGPPGQPTERVKLKNSKGTIMRLWNYLSNNTFAIVMAFVFVALNAILTILASYMVRPIINGLLTDEGIESLIRNLIIMGIIYVFAFVSNYIQSRIMLEIAQSSLEKLRTDLFTKLQKLPLRYFDSNNNGDLMSRFTNDVDAISQMLSNTCVQLISGVITLITTIAIMFYTNWFLTLVTLLVTPLFTFVTKAISRRSMRYYKAQQQAIGNLNGYIEESITGQKVIKVFNHEEEAIHEFDKLNDDYKDTSFKAQFIGGIMGPIMGGLSLLSYSITAFVGGLLCIFGNFDIGGYSIFVNYARSFSRPINDIFMQINTVFSALAGAERVFEVIDEEPEIEDAADCVALETIKGDVVLDDVSFGYLKDRLVLKNISLSANVGKKIAFVGSTGAGKTTITNLLNRFYDINMGTITIDGIDIMKIKKEFLRQNIALVLQDTHLFTGSVRENIRYGRLDATDEEVITAAKIANADSFIRRLENGYDTMLDGDGTNLSQGQRQLLNIARAAISKAPILVLDEATSSVDTRTERHIETALDRLMETRTTFVIAHRLSTVRNSDLIIVLEAGETIERGSHDELLAQKGKYYSLYTGAAKLE
ncbi:MAG: ABC transporter ATP-binding protein [Eubacteriales bacterium]